MRIGVNETQEKTEGCLVGHELQIEALSKELRIIPRSSDYACPYASIFYVSGPSGIGKRTFITRVLENETPCDIPRIIYHIDPCSDDSIDGQLKHLAYSNKPYFSWLLEQLAAEMEERTHCYEESGRSLPQIGRLALWSGLFKQRIVENPGVNSLQILFVLHDISSHSELHRKLVARVIPKGNDRVDVRIIATGISDAAEQDFYDLFWDRAPTTHITLPPLTLKDVEKWLYEKERPIELAKKILEMSDGLPVQFESAYATLMTGRENEIPACEAETLLDGINDELRKCVGMSALLPEINKDTLRAILPDDSITETLKVLRTRNWPKCTWDQDSFIFGHEVGQELQSWLNINHKTIADQTMGIAGQLQAICAMIPSYKDRDTLACLTAFNYFNHHAIMAIMPEIADRASALVAQKGKTYFEKSGPNLRIRPEVRQMVDVYSELTRRPTNDLTSIKIRQLWKNRKTALSNHLSKLREKVDGDADHLVSIKRYKYDVYANNNQNACLKNHELQQQGLKSDTKDKRISNGKIAGLIMQGIGTCILYICMLSASRISSVFAIFGLTLIVSGFFTDKTEADTIPRTTPSDTRDDCDVKSFTSGFQNNEERDTVSELRHELESKESWLAAQITEEKREMRDLVRRLDEPYVRE